jgi:drug/metabolite transporter (DMT)-like permease
LSSILLGLACALAWGAADFTGGIASKRTRAFGVVIGAELTGMLLVAGLALATREPIPPLQTWLWSSAAGLSAGFGLMLLYRALASGRMSVAAPISALIGAMLPVVIGAFLEGLPGPWAIAGILLALAAVWMIAGGTTGWKNIDFKEISLPLLAGVFFGVFLVGINRSGQEAIFWPITAARLGAALSLLVYARLTRQAWQPARVHWGLIAFSGLLDVSGNLLYVLSAQSGRMDITAVISSLYPGSTVLLAAALLHERINPAQLAGIIAALAAIVLMTV